MFDLNRAIKDSRLSKAEILRLQKEIKKDYPDDMLLYELHMIRALRPALREKRAAHRRVGVVMS